MCWGMQAVNQNEISRESLVRILEIMHRLAAPEAMPELLREIVEVGKVAIVAEAGVLWLLERQTGVLKMVVPSKSSKSTDAGNLLPQAHKFWEKLVASRNVPSKLTTLETSQSFMLWLNGEFQNICATVVTPDTSQLVILLLITINDYY